MNTPAISPCICGSKLAPRLEDSARDVGLFSLGVYVACPSCMMGGPRTWILFEEAEVERELIAAQTEAIRTWNRIVAAVGLLEHLTEDHTGRFPSLRGTVG